MIQRIIENGPAVFILAALLRIGLLIYGRYQDEWSAFKYTDIDYYVFTDAARNVVRGASPYARDTYRYTPLLAWLLVPTAWSRAWFDFGKAIFAASDVLAGWFIYRILRSSHAMPSGRALRFASIWLLNPMVAQISTRGSSEGLLIAMVMAVLWATLQHSHILAGCLLGLSVHFKIYPFIYASSIFWWLGGKDDTEQGMRLSNLLVTLTSLPRLKLALFSAITFCTLNASMFFIYGKDFVRHTFLYHLIRSDHRHNFSPYNSLLYMNSSPVSQSDWHPEALAFVPQIILSTVLLPLVLAKRDLASCMLCQTLVFVAFNKVCTSQYFLWYIAFLPFYLPGSSLLQDWRRGTTTLILWVVGQGLWLQQGYQLEFLGNSTFVPGLWLCSLAFFAINVWILGVVIWDIRRVVPSQPGIARLKAHQ